LLIDHPQPYFVHSVIIGFVWRVLAFGWQTWLLSYYMWLPFSWA
jgi:hypothetical protein